MPNQKRKTAIMNLFLFTISLLSISTIHYYLFSMPMPENKNIPIKQDIAKEHKVHLQMAQIQKSQPKPKEEPIIKKELPKKETKKPIIKKIKKKKVEKKKPVKKRVIKQKVKSEIKKTKEVKKQIKETKQELVKKPTKPIKSVQPKTSINKEKIKKEQDRLKNQYLHALRAKINENKHYPRISKRLKEQGVATISFRVLKNGNFINIKVLKTSSKKRLDKAALEAISDTNSFMAFDKKIKASYMDIIIPIEFKLQ